MMFTSGAFDKKTMEEFQKDSKLWIKCFEDVWCLIIFKRFRTIHSHGVLFCNPYGPCPMYLVVSIMLFKGWKNVGT